MTETELIDRLRESIVLDGPDAWRSNGYLEDAQRMGWKLVTALKRANEVTQEIGYARAWMQAIRTRIARLAQMSGAPTEQDLEPIIRAAAALNLSADFVRNRWVPTELTRLRNPSANGAGGRPTPNFSAVAIEPVPVLSRPAVVASVSAPARPVAISEPAPVASAVSVTSEPDPRPPVSDVTLPPETEPLSVVQSFTATPNRIRRGESVTLAWIVDNLPTVTVDDLGTGLPARHQGWVKPSKTTEYTLFDPDKKPLRTVRVEVAPRDRSVLWGILGALLLIGGFLWYNTAGTARREPVRRPARATAQQKNPVQTGASEGYDKVEADADERGWRRARKNGRWGFIDQDNQWIIQPEYDLVTPFRRGRAVVVQKGRLITINRDGEPVGQ